MILLALILSFILGGEHTSWDVVWVGDEGYMYDGVEPDYALGDSLFTFRVKVRGISQPADNVCLYIDAEGDGRFSLVNRMNVEKQDDDGYIYRATVRISPPSGNRMLSYYFTAQVGSILRATPITFGPLFRTRLSFAILTSWVWEPSSINPLQVVISREQERFLILNDGDVPIRLGLAVSAQKSDWLPADNESGLREDRFVLSAVFTPQWVHSVDALSFNRNSSDDVIGFVPKFSSGDILGVDRVNPGDRLEPGDTVALWFLFRAPSSASFEKSEGYSIFVKVFAIPTK